MSGFLDERAGLAGKAAIILGGGGGLGRAIADDLGAAGVGLALADRDEALLADAVAHAESIGASVVSTVGDVRDDAVIDRVFALAEEAHGRLDVLVNVVGGTFRQPFAESNRRGWDALIRTNFTWLLRPTQMAIARMRAGGRGGSIINLTSIEAHRAAPNFAVYAGMKAGVENWGRSLAVELAPEGIRVNTIAADMVPTEGIVAAAEGRGDASPWGEGVLDERRTTIAIPMGRRGRYEDVGNCALFLASDLSTYVTGTSMHPDGGAFASSGWFNWPGAGFTNVPPLSVISAIDGPDPTHE
ncbi:MAG: SDR family oxidoreductase [Ilumatobacteraceae bacterium]